MNIHGNTQTRSQTLTLLTKKNLCLIERQISVGVIERQISVGVIERQISVGVIERQINDQSYVFF